MKAFTATMLAAFLVAVLLVAPSTAAFPRRVLLDVASCEEECQDTYETNVKKCISDTQLGKPPPIEKKAAEATDMMTLAYVPPEKTGFELVEEDCRKLQGPELDKCLLEGCKKDKKDCTAVGKKCDDSFKEGTILAAWCRQEEGC